MVKHAWMPIALTELQTVRPSEQCTIGICQYQTSLSQRLRNFQAGPSSGAMISTGNDLFNGSCTPQNKYQPAMILHSVQAILHSSVLCSCLPIFCSKCMLWSAWVLPYMEGS